MLTKKHFKELTKIHAKALKAIKDNDPKTAYNIFEFGLRDFYQSINVNFDDLKFEKRTQKLANTKPAKLVESNDLTGFDAIDHLERRELLDAQMNN